MRDKTGDHGRSVTGTETSDRLVGVSVDGDRVTVVETLDDMAVSSVAVTAKTLGQAVDLALGGVRQRRNDPAIRVALVSPTTLLRRIDVTASLARSRSAFDDAVFAALPANRDVSATAGAFFAFDDPNNDESGDAVSVGAAVIAPLDRIREVYEAFGRRRIELVASPLVLTGFDGVWLGLHHSAAEVTLVVDGRTLAYRQLRAGGLSALLPLLGDPSVEGLGVSRLSAILTGSGDADPLARVELGRYLRMVVAELSQTLDYWRRSGEPVPAGNQVLVYGAGAGVPAARSALTDAGLQSTVPDRLAQGLSYLQVGARPEALTAFCAAVSVGRHMPQASFVNPSHAAIRTATLRRRRRLYVTGGLVAAATFAGVFVAKPLVDGWSAARDADRERAVVTAQYAEKADLYAQSVELETRSGVVAAARAAEPDWGRVYRTVLVSLPPGAVLDQAAFVVDDAVVALSASVSLPGGNYTNLTGWLARLESIDGVVQAWSSGFSQRDGIASFSVSVRLDPDVLADVALPAPAPAPAPVDVPVDSTAPAADATGGA